MKPQYEQIPHEDYTMKMADGSCIQQTKTSFPPIYVYCPVCHPDMHEAHLKQIKEKV